MFRQGDVLIVRSNSIPKNSKKQKDCIVAYGEATGHKHEINPAEASMYIHAGRKYIEVRGESAVVTHPEHKSITLPGNTVYRVVQQREYTPEEIISNGSEVFPVLAATKNKNGKQEDTLLYWARLLPSRRIISNRRYKRFKRYFFKVFHKLNPINETIKSKDLGWWKVIRIVLHRN